MHTMKKSLLFVGLDVHAQNITLAVAPGGKVEARLDGTNNRNRKGVRRRRLSPTHVPLHRPNRSLSAVRMIADHARIGVWKLKPIQFIPRSGNVLKESLTSKNIVEPSFQKPVPRVGNSPASLASCHLTKNTNSKLAHLTAFIRVRPLGHFSRLLSDTRNARDSCRRMA
jgi:hypothetical protein